MIKEIRDGKLYFDECDTTELAKEYGTPLYVMSQTDIESRLDELKRDFTDKYDGARVAYASKAFCTVGMYKILDKAGASIDVVSGGELYAAKKAGFPAERIELNGNNKLVSAVSDLIGPKVSAGAGVKLSINAGIFAFGYASSIRSFSCALSPAAFTS